MVGRIIEKQLSDADVAISNGIEDHFIRTALEPYEYTMDRMLAGVRLVEKARTFYQRRLEEKYQQAKEWMIPYWNICRLALAGHPEQFGKLKYKK